MFGGFIATVAAVIAPDGEIRKIHSRDAKLYAVAKTADFFVVRVDVGNFNFFSFDKFKVTFS